MAPPLGTMDAPETPCLIDRWRRPYTPGLFTPEEFEQYWTLGFVLKKDVFAPEELEPAREAVNRGVADIADDLFKAGKIKNKHEDAPLETRLTLIEEQFPSASVLLHKRGVLPKEFQALWTDPRLMSVARQLLGDDIGGHPVWNLRPKTPQQEQATVPWHQDAAYLDKVAWEVHQVTAWIPLVPASERNGCMQVVPGGHRTGRTAKHTCCAGGTWYVELDETDAAQTLGVDLQSAALTCEVPLGGVLFLNNILPHRSLNNLSDGIRWSLDLRWQKWDQPAGFYGLKEVIPMTKSGQPDYKVDWDGWANLSRSALQEGILKPETKSLVETVKAIDASHVVEPVLKIDGVSSVMLSVAKSPDSPTSTLGDPFDTTIAGPWMDQWPIVFHNRHTERHERGSVQGWHKA
ncbi:hypothetical protein KFL_000150440 [Klebsormidium nitens]|uniref:Phytanoyl-CoA dioxygenase n=1 Tax=Klebsormidium nitens TaxID=105231 RepID=A0A1Y1HJ93_KLENI|nr:hypothetical protein KFL_000150440 [Klebsormidium nitens]|eukprot:GAQ78590.1 hypothetical protein KFL_000150440 [Klebsormidium nitens]